MIIDKEPVLNFLRAAVALSGGVTIVAELRVTVGCANADFFYRGFGVTISAHPSVLGLAKCSLTVGLNVGEWLRLAEQETSGTLYVCVEGSPRATIDLQGGVKPAKKGKGKKK